MMNVFLNDGSFSYDVHSLTKAFYPAENVKIVLPEHAGEADRESAPCGIPSAREQELPADPVHDHADSRQQQRHDERAHPGKQEELLQEVARKAGQPSGTPVGLADIVRVEREQVHLFPAEQMIGIHKPEKAPRTQESRSREAGEVEPAFLFLHR